VTDTISDFIQRRFGQEEDSGITAAQVVIGSVEEAPDQVAGDMNLAREFGRTFGQPTPPTPLVREYRNVFQRRIEEERARTMLSGKPRLTDWLRDQDNAAIARDSLAELGWFEGLGRGVANTAERAGARGTQMLNQYMLEQTAGRAADRDKTFGQIVDDERTVVRNSAGDEAKLWASPGDYMSAFGRWADARYAELIGTDDEAAAAEYAKRVGESVEWLKSIPKSEIATRFEADAMVDGASFGEALANFGNAFAKNPIGGLSWALETAGESAPQLAAALGTTVATRNPMAGVAVGFAGSYATERYTSPAEFLQEKGIDLTRPGDVQKLLADPGLMQEAADRGVIRGAVVGAFDALSMGIAGRSLATNPMIEALAQGASQALFGSSGELAARVAAGQEIDWNEVIAEGIAEVATAPVDMGIAGRKFIQKRDGAARADATTEQLSAIAQQATASTLRARSPEKFQEFVAKAVEGGEVENVYVPAEAFVTYFQSIGVDPFVLVDEELDGVTREDLEAALLAPGADLRIPTATYAAKIAGTEHDGFMLQNMRFDPAEMTAVDAAEFNERAQEAMQEAYELADQLRQREEELRSYETQIYETMVSQLRVAGRSANVARTEAMLWPAFYRVMAERSGVTIGEFMQSYPLPQVRGAVPEGIQYKDVDALNRTLAEARARRKAGIGTKGQSLLEFISDYGGILDVGGELKARDARLIKRGAGRKSLRLAREEGAATANLLGGGETAGRQYGADSVARAAIEAGFLVGDPAADQYRAAVAAGQPVPDITPALWEAIDRELRGEPQYAAAEVDDDAAAREAQLDEIEEYLAALGLTLDDDDAAIRAAVDADQAAGRAYGQGDDRNLVVQHNLTAANLLHATKLGGLPVPSIAISNVDHPLDNFGEITLIGGPDMVDARKDRSAKVFDADVYSPRYPTVVYKLSGPALRKAWKQLGSSSDDLGHVLSSELDDSEVERNGLGAFRDSSAVQLQFLRETGRPIDLPQRKARSSYMERNPALRPAIDRARDAAGLGSAYDDPAVLAEIEKAVAVELQRVADAAPDMSIEERRGIYYSRHGLKRSVVESALEEYQLAQAGPKVDRGAARVALRDAIQPHAKAFAEWVDSKFGDVIDSERVQTQTAGGNWKLLPHTLDSVVKILKSKLRDGEGWNYGVGSIRSTVANQFKSISAVRAARGRLIPHDAMQAVKEEVDREFSALAGRFGEISPDGQRFGFLDTFSEQLKEVAERGPRAFDAYYKALPDDLRADAVAFLGKLRDMPTEYFEAKIQRAVGLNEFSAAVIPKTAALDVRTALESAGVPLVEYDPSVSGSRAVAMRRAGEQGNLLFQAAIDKGGRHAPVQIDPNTPVPSVTLTDLPAIATHAEARDAVRLGDVTNVSGDRVSISKSSAAKWLSVNANAMKRSIAPYADEIFAQSVTYHRGGEFDYAVGHLVLDGEDIAVRFVIRNTPGRGRTLYQFEGEKVAPISARTIEGQAAVSAGATTTREMSVADLVEPFNAMASGSFTLFQDESTARGLGPRGSIQFPANGVGNGETIISLFERADLSTFVHESGHYFLTILQDLAARGEQSAVAEIGAVRTWWRSNAADVAKDAMRVAPDASVTADDVLAALDNGTTGDRMKDLAIDAGMQEQWARGFEAYLMEGKAPSVELRSVFDRLRAWMVSIYRRLTGLNVKVSDDLRAVFDRLLATDEEIAKALDASGAAGAVFATPEQIGLTADEFAALNRLRAQSEEEAKAKLLGDVMEPIKRQKEKWWKEERAAVRAQVEREVNAHRHFRAIEWMGNRRWLGEGKPEGMPDIRLSKDVLVQRYGEGVLSTLPRGKQTVYAVEGGVDPDDIAGWFGFDSGDAMIRAMETAPKRRDAIEAETDRVMNERHGDALNDGEIELNALDAVHTTKRGDWIAAELRAVSEVAGLGPSLTMKEARFTAAQTIARMKVRDATHAQRYLAAERRAAEEAAQIGAQLAREKVWLDAAGRRIASKARAAAKGSGSQAAVAKAIDAFNKKLETTTSTFEVAPQERVSPKGNAYTIPGGERTATSLGYNDLVAKMVDAKRRQLLNHAFYMEARKVGEEVDKAERLVRRLEKSTRKIRSERLRKGEASIAGDYVEAIEAIIYGYEFRKVPNRQIDRRAALRAYVDQMISDGRANELAIPQAVLDDAQVVNYRTLTVEHLRGVVDSLKNIEHVARMKGQMLINKRKRDFEEAKTSVVDAIEKNMKSRAVDWVKDTGLNAKARDLLNGYVSTIQSATTILRQMDGREDLGVVYETLKSDMDSAAYAEREMRKEATDRILELYSVYSPEEQREMAVRRVMPALGGRSFSKWNLIAMALNMGNEGNLARLTNTAALMHLPAEQVEALKASLDRRDWDFVQSVWDYIETFRPKVAERDRRVRGIEPTWVEAKPVQTPHGVYRGGYYPIKYEGRLGGARFVSGGSDADILNSMMSGGYASASTKDGHLKARGQHVRQSLMLDVSVIAQHANEVIHDLAFSEPVVNTWRILTSNEVEQAALRAGLDKQHAALKLWVQDAASGQVGGGGDLARSVAFLRSGFTYSKLALNLKTILLQPLGLIQSGVVVGKRNLAAQIARTVRHPVEMTNDVVARSRMMWERQQTFNKDLMDAAAKSNIASPARGKLAEFWSEYAVPFGMAGITYSQFYIVDVPTWAAAYQKGLAQFGTEAKAVEFADMTVQRSQSSGIWSDRSGIERGTLSSTIRQNPFVMLLTTLGSYFFAKMNLIIERTQGLRAEKITPGRAMSYALDLSLLLAGEAAVLALIGEAFDDDDEEDDSSFLGTVAAEGFKTFLAGLPVVRDMAGLSQGFQAGTYASILQTGWEPVRQAGQGEFDKQLVKSTVNLTGLLTRLPSAQANRLIDGAWREMEGEEVSAMEYIFGRNGK